MLIGTELEYLGVVFVAIPEIKYNYCTGCAFVSSRSGSEPGVPCPTCTVGDHIIFKVKSGTTTKRKAFE